MFLAQKSYFNLDLFYIVALAFKNSVTGSSSQAPTVPEAEPIGVFWDIENCPVPRGKSASAVVQKIRKEFFTGKREVEFMCVCDISKEKKEIIEELNKAQVRFSEEETQGNKGRQRRKTDREIIVCAKDNSI